MSYVTSELHMTMQLPNEASLLWNPFWETLCKTHPTLTENSSPTAIYGAMLVQRHLPTQHILCMPVAVSSRLNVTTSVLRQSCQSQLPKTVLAFPLAVGRKLMPTGDGVLQYYNGSE